MRKLVAGLPVGDGDRLKVFISYSRRDGVVADAMVRMLGERGFEVKIDRRDLPFGEKWQVELAEFIRLCDTVIWLVSEASVRSKWVNWELDEVARRNKRLVPVMIAETPRDTLPRQLGEIHILPAQGAFDLSRDVDALVRVLETDHQWLKEASRLQDRAHEWLSAARGSALLLRSGALSSAEQWKDRRPAKAPAPAQEVLDLLLASRQAATQRQRWWIGGSLAVAAGALGLAGFAYVQSIEADRQRDLALKNETRAVEQEKTAVVERDRATVQRNLALSTNAKILARDSERALEGNDPVKALLIALEGLPGKPGDRPHVWQAERAANAALLQWRAVSTVVAPVGWGDWTAVFSADGQTIFGESEFNDPLNRAAIWRTRTGERIAHFEGKVGGPRVALLDPKKRFVFVAPTVGPSGLVALSTMDFTPIAVSGTAIVAAALSENGARLLTAHDDGKARLWAVPGGAPVRTFEVGAPAPLHMLLSDDGRKAVITTTEREMLIFSEETSAAKCRLSHVKGPSPTFRSFALSDTRLVTARLHAPTFGVDGLSTATLWNLDTCTSMSIDPDLGGRPLGSLFMLGAGERMVLSTVFTDTALSRSRGAVVVWDSATGRVVQRVDNVFDHAETGRGAVFVAADPSVKGRMLVTDTDGRAVELQDDLRDGEFDSVKFDPQGTRLTARRGLIRFALWDAHSGRKIATLERSGADSVPIVFSPDGKILVAAEAGVFQLWTAKTGTRTATFDAGGRDGVAIGFKVAFSADTSRLLAGSGGTTHTVFSIASSVRSLDLAGDVHDAEFSANGERVVADPIPTSGETRRLAWDARTGERQLLSREEDLRLGDVAVARDKADAGATNFFARTRPPPPANAASATEAAGRKTRDGLQGLEDALQDFKNFFDRQQADQLKRFGLSDLGFLVHVGPERVPWHWLIGNDGRVTQEPADDAASPKLKVMNGRSTSSEHVTLPDSHQMVIGFHIQDIAFGHNGTQVATIGYDGRVGAPLVLKIWRRGAIVGEMVFDKAQKPSEMLFEPTGRRLLVMFEDKTLQLIDTVTFTPVAVLPVGAELSSFSANADGSRILTIDDAQNLRLWMIEPTTAALVARGRELVPRCLSLQERERDLQLDPEPPRWCITGPGLEVETDPAKWQPKHPYANKNWRNWLVARDKGDTPPLPDPN